MSTASPQTYDCLVPSKSWQQPLQVFLKRLMDVLISGLLLLLLSPVFLVLGAMVRMTSRGPAFYAWRVVGKNGEPFTGYKFRSMIVNADELKVSLAARNEMTGPMFKITNDPRITWFGGWLRRYSLDELPQLYSVFKGDMSLVGPRPPLQTEYDRFSAYQKQKLAVTPGITCLWQISGRNEVSDFDEWVALDLDYIRSWSLWIDIKILLRTALVVIAGSGK